MGLACGMYMSDNEGYFPLQAMNVGAGIDFGWDKAFLTYIDRSNDVVPNGRIDVSERVLSLWEVLKF